MELPARQEQPKPPKWRSLLWFGGGCLTSLVMYATVVIEYLVGARLFGGRFGEFEAFAWTTVLQLLAAGITAVPASRWRRFGAGLSVGGGLVLLLLELIALLVYVVDHTELTF
jgi:hypothetical protein